MGNGQEPRVGVELGVGQKGGSRKPARDTHLLPTQPLGMVGDISSHPHGGYMKAGIGLDLQVVRVRGSV